ncbi:very long chain fatty acid elongase 7 [Anabrus simplex]|uniref:very long chain fatty acid elongase 7 n=1 Tax=Anabrus simplex TaxID=316456 RepID=UPI0034DDB0E1
MAMLVGLQTMVDNFANFIEDKSDPRTRHWFMVENPLMLVMLLVLYLYFCTTAGPKFMKDRKPFELKNVLLAYNVFQVVFSCYLVWEGLHGGWMHYYNFRCQSVDYSDNPIALRMARAVWLYYMCKLIELLDTVFFVLRKKNNQVTGLHVWHHTLMPVTGWIAIRFLPGGQGTLLGIINSFVHIIMYSYYLLAGLGPQYQKYLWWKKYLTMLQLVQFTIIFIHNIQPLIFGGCDYPRIISILLCVNQLNFMYLFGMFYIRTYRKSKKLQ